MTTKLTSKYIPVNHKALIGILEIDNRITKCYFRDLFCGKEFTMDLSITVQQVKDWYYGKPIHLAMPTLSKEIRELFITGITDKEFSKLLEKA